jgi:hypothetical protein
LKLFLRLVPFTARLKKKKKSFRFTLADYNSKVLSKHPKERKKTFFLLVASLYVLTVFFVSEAFPRAFSATLQTGRVPLHNWMLALKIEYRGMFWPERTISE